MAARHVFTLALGLTLSSSSLAVTPAAGASEEQIREAPQEANAKYKFIGRVNTNAIPVRSGPSNNFYATQKLEKGESVTVVGMKYDWLKILPPKGSFSFVPAAYVTRRGDGKVGRVNSSLNVRAGSSLNGMKTTVQVRMEEGQDVKILDTQDEYFKIEPPEGAYVYINKQYVDVVGRADELNGQVAKADKTAPADVEKPAPGTTEPAAPQDAPDGIATTTTPEKGVVAVDKPSVTQPADAVATAKPEAAEDFRKLEAEFEAASKQPVPEQPIEQLTERYTKLVKSGTLTGTSKRMADARLVALKMRSDARAQLDAFKKSQDEMRQRQRDLAIENQEITDRIKQTQVALYTAVGTLRVSSIQQGNTTLYRLVDPTSGRAVVYIRSNDAKYAGLLNQFVGVRGELTSDERLKMKIITPTEAEPVDASKVNSSVIATITPPGMMPMATTIDQGDARN